MADTDTNTARGIQNAGARYQERVEDLTTEAQVYKRKRQSKQKQRINSEGVPEYVGPRTTVTQRGIKAFEQNLKGVFESQDIEYEEGDAELLISNRPETPSLPMGILFLAIVKDTLDVFLGITVVLSLLIFIVTVPVMLILAFYFFNKMSGVRWKKKLITWFWKRYIVALLIEFIPFVGLIPATTILVLMAHYRETAFVQSLNAALDSLRGNPDLARAVKGV